MIGYFNLLLKIKYKLRMLLPKDKDNLRRKTRLIFPLRYNANVENNMV